MMILTQEHPFKVFCLPTIFWNRLSNIIQYKNGKMSDVNWLINQYNLSYEGGTDSQED